MYSLTKQEWFNAAWERSAHQVPNLGGPDGDCVYSHPSDQSEGCFIGCVASYEDALRWDDAEATVGLLLRRAHVEVSDATTYDVAARFLHQLQVVHDTEPPDEWRDSLRRIASSEGLTVPE